MCTLMDNREVKDTGGKHGGSCHKGIRQACHGHLLGTCCGLIVPLTRHCHEADRAELPVRTACPDDPVNSVPVSAEFVFKQGVELFPRLARLLMTCDESFLKLPVITMQ
jgi:hypothetical protein